MSTFVAPANGTARPIPDLPAPPQVHSVVEAPTSPVAAMNGSKSTVPAPLLADPLLALSADVLDDLEKVWIANTNRLRQLARAETDADGVDRGFGLTEDHPDVARLAALVADLDKAQQDATKILQRMMRRHPLGPWVKAQRGIGEKQAARLLAAIGDPYWHDLEDRPRAVGELWSYSGYGDAEKQVRRRGEKITWSPDAKMRAFLIAEKCMMLQKPGERYRDVYDAAREKYRDSLHPKACVRCGPAGKPAVAGSPRSAGHQHAMALRAVAKEILRDLWVESKRLHEGYAHGD